MLSRPTKIRSNCSRLNHRSNHRPRPKLRGRPRRVRQPATDAKADVNADVKADKAEASEPPDRLLATRPDSILGLSTTIVAPIERAAPPTPPSRDERDEEEGDGHETTALPFVPIKADERISPALSRLHDSVLIDDNSRID